MMYRAQLSRQQLGAHGNDSSACPHLQQISTFQDLASMTGSGVRNKPLPRPTGGYKKQIPQFWTPVQYSYGEDYGTLKWISTTFGYLYLYLYASYGSIGLKWTYFLDPPRRFKPKEEDPASFGPRNTRGPSMRAAEDRQKVPLTY